VNLKRKYVVRRVENIDSTLSSDKVHVSWDIYLSIEDGTELIAEFWGEEAEAKKNATLCAKALNRKR